MILQFIRKKLLEGIYLLIGINHAYTEKNDPQSLMGREYVGIKEMPIVDDKQMISLLCPFVNLPIGNSADS